MVSSESERTRELTRVMAGRIAEMIQPLNDTAVMVPDTEWTVGETAAHLAYTKDLMARMVAGEPITYADGTREGFARANIELLVGFTERDGSILAGMIESSVHAFCRSASVLGPEDICASPLGPIPADTFTAYVLTHLMQHGEAIARALGKPSILDRASVVAAVPFLLFVFERFVDTDAVGSLTAAYEVRLRGGPRFYVTFEKGVVRVTTAPAGRIDCYISADPEAFFRVGIRLTSQWGPIARLKMTTWGRKPWLALRFAGTFRPP